MIEGSGIKRAHPDDKGPEEHMAIAQVEKPSAEVKQSASSRLAEMEQAYERWLRNYVNQPGKTWGVYCPTENALVVRVFSGPEASGSVFNYMRGFLKHYSFFPETPIPSSPRFVSDHEAVLNDWAMVGSDLYGAIQKYRMNSPFVRLDTETDERATAAW
jgi:hypothetical protein